MLKLNDTTYIAQDDRQSIGAVAMGQTISALRQFNQWDIVEAWAYQDSGGALNITSDNRSFFACNARPTVLLATPYVNIQDQKSSGTEGGTFTAGADRTRDLNTIVSDATGLAALAGNQITLLAGRYRTSISCPAVQVGNHQAWLYNVTGAAVLLRGTSEYAGAISGGSGNSSNVAGTFTITGPTVLEVRHRCTATVAGFGFGDNCSFGTEVYTVAEFWREG
jgi:hypothetical protein